MEAPQLRFRGIPVFMDGKEFIVPSLSVIQFRNNFKDLTSGLKDEETAADFMARTVPLIGLAIRRNYPEVTDEYLLDVVDLNTFRDLQEAIRAASGLKPVTPGGAEPVATK